MLVDAPERGRKITNVELFGHTYPEPLIRVTKMRAGFYQYATKINAMMQVTSIDVVDLFMRQQGWRYYIVDQKTGTDEYNDKIQPDDHRIRIVQPNMDGLEELIAQAEVECT